MFTLVVGVPAGILTKCHFSRVLINRASESQRGKCTLNSTFISGFIVAAVVLHALVAEQLALMTMTMALARGGEP